MIGNGKFFMVLEQKIRVTCKERCRVKQNGIFFTFAKHRNVAGIERKTLAANDFGGSIFRVWKRNLGRESKS